MITSQKNFLKALQAGNWKLAQRQLEQGKACLGESDSEKIAVLMHALGPGGGSAEQTVEGWTWLDKHGFTHPTSVDAHEAILSAVLKERPLAAADAWMIRSVHDAIPQRLLGQAIQRRNTEALDWWVGRGLPLTEDQANTGIYPHILLAIAQHKLNALPHVQWLLNHGVKPLARQLPQDTDETDTPLLRCTQHYRDYLTTFPKQHDKNFRALWLLLVEAGESPHTPSALGETPLSILEQTASKGWWEARQREEALSQVASPSRRMRPRG